MLSLLSFMFPESFSLTSVTPPDCMKLLIQSHLRKVADIHCTPTVCQALSQTSPMSAHLVLDSPVRLVTAILHLKRVRFTSHSMADPGVTCSPSDRQTFKGNKAAYLTVTQSARELPYSMWSPYLKSLVKILLPLGTE